MSEIQKLKNEIQELKIENEKRLQMITKLENQLYKSAYYKEGSYAIEAVERGQIIAKQEKEIQKLKNEIQKLKDENKKLKSNKTISAAKIHNERGAGRKSKLKDHDKEVIKMYRLQGKTIKEISELYNCSVGLVHKIINEKN